MHTLMPYRTSTTSGSLRPFAEMMPTTCDSLRPPVGLRCGMILTHRIAEAVSRGEVRLAFRRWRRPSVRAGDVFHSSAGLVTIDSVEIVDPAAISAADARAAGLDSVEALVATFRAAATDPVFRIG